MLYWWNAVRDLNKIDTWERREPTSDDGLTEHGEVWRNTDDSTEEIIIDRSKSEEHGDWTVMLPDGRQRFSREKDIVVAMAGLYMETGSL